jgi:3'-phosphoadenosine 5'-phosphosulfate sulfotransferase
MVIFRTIAFSQIGFFLLFGSNRLTQNFILSQYIYNKLSQLERSFILCEMAQSFGMMMVKVEAREFRLKQIIEELEDTKARLKEDADGVREG